MADKRRILSIDLESFSDVDLAKCGVYRYVEGDFHILLFAYAFDDEEAKIVDLACGEQLPQEVVDAIFDDSIIKAAWNAQFERTCLSKYFNTRLSPVFYGVGGELITSLEAENCCGGVKNGRTKR